jgi:hypothetical protein
MHTFPKLFSVEYKQVIDYLADFEVEDRSACFEKCRVGPMAYCKDRVQNRLDAELIN